MASIPRGRFVWYDLMTTDPKAAQDFYKQVAGWGTQDWEGAQQPYTMWTRGETPMGGVMQLPEDAKQMGAPPHWLSYITTPDIDGTVKQAQEKGARLLHGPQAIPTVGRFAVMMDPQGAVFSPFQPDQAQAGDWNPQVGDVSWHELATSDSEAAFAFYKDLFGWEVTSEMDMGGGSMYKMYGEKAGGRPYGGIYKFQPGQPPHANWLPYIRVTDLNKRLETVKQLGGQVLMGPMEVPGGDHVAVGMDPQGAAFALHETAAA